MNGSERAGDKFPAINRVVDLADMGRHSSLEFAHAGGGGCGNHEFGVGTRGSRALISSMQTFISPTLTAWSQTTCRLVIACLRLLSYRPNRWPKPLRQFPRRQSRKK